MPSSDPRPALTTIQRGAHSRWSPALRDYESYSEIYESTPTRKRRRRFDDEAPGHSRRPAPDLSALDERLGADPDGPPEGDRWSTWTAPSTARTRARRGWSPSTRRSTTSWA